MLTLSVLVVVMAVAAPSMADFTANNQVVSAKSSFAGAVALARTEAAKRGRVVILQALGDGPNGNEFANGWEIVADDDNHGLAGANETRLRRAGQVALWVYVNPVYGGGTQRSERVTGVERLAMTYGVDTDGDFAADRFQRTDPVTDWAQVVDARVELLQAGNSDTQASSIQPYVFAGETVTPTDRKQRAVMSMRVSLRNAVP